MEDRIEGVSDREKVYELLDKICDHLKEDKHSDTFTYNRQSTNDGMIIKIFSLSNKRTIIINSDLRKNIVDISINIPNHYKDENFATLYKENSNSCANFLLQIEEENRKIYLFLDEILQELDTLKPIQPIKEKESPKIKVSKFRTIVNSIKRRII